jgi:hypothetical protein
MDDYGFTRSPAGEAAKTETGSIASFTGAFQLAGVMKSAPLIAANVLAK